MGTTSLRKAEGRREGTIEGILVGRLLTHRAGFGKVVGVLGEISFKSLVMFLILCEASLPVRRSLPLSVLMDNSEVREGRSEK